MPNMKKMILAVLPGMVALALAASGDSRVVGIGNSQSHAISMQDPKPLRLPDHWSSEQKTWGDETRTVCEFMRTGRLDISPTLVGSVAFSPVTPWGGKASILWTSTMHTRESLAKGSHDMRETLIDVRFLGLDSESLHARCSVRYVVPGRKPMADPIEYDIRVPSQADAYYVNVCPSSWNYPTLKVSLNQPPVGGLCVTPVWSAK